MSKEQAKLDKKETELSPRIEFNANKPKSKNQANDKKRSFSQKRRSRKDSPGDSMTEAKNSARRHEYDSNNGNPSIDAYLMTNYNKSKGFMPLGKRNKDYY